MAILLPNAGGPVNETERAVTAMLASELPDQYVLLPNVLLDDPRRGSPYEIDLIVVAPHAVFVVEIKGWRGTVETIDRARWLVRGTESRANPLVATGQKARVLATALKRLDLSAAGRRLRTPWVHACVVLASNAQDVELIAEQRRNVLLVDEAAAFLTDPSALGSRTLLPEYASHTEAIARYIRGDVAGSQTVTRVYGEYEVIEDLEQTDNGIIALAKHRFMRDGRVWRVRTWHISPYLFDEASRERQIEILRRSSEALSRVGLHPNLAEHRAFGENDSTFFEVSEWSRTGTLGDGISRGLSHRLALPKKLGLLIDICRGLEQAHAAGVHHRNLTADAILLSANGVAKVCKFERAFIEDATGTVFGAVASGAFDTSRPPELRGTSVEVFDSTDVYGVGVIAYELLTGELPRREQRDGRIVWLSASELARGTSAHGEALDALLVQCLADDPDERPASMQALRERLEAIASPEPARGLRPEPQQETEFPAPSVSVNPQDSQKARGSRELSSLAGTGAGPQSADRYPSGTAALSSPSARAEPAPAAPPFHTSALEVGAVVGGANTVVALVGQGQHTRVYHVQNDVLLGSFALKLTTPSHPDARRPVDELRMLRRVEHPAVVRAHWADTLAEGPGYLLMDLLEGPTLTEHLRADDARADDAASEVADRVSALLTLADGLAALHSAGIVHRDVKPDNIVLTALGPVLCDLSIAADVGASGPSLGGTQRYTPPDAQSSGWGPEADVFAWGCLAREWLEGEHPWGNGVPTNGVEPAATRLPNDAIARVVQQAYAPTAAGRFASGAELAAALHAAVAAQEASLTAASTETAEAPEPSETPIELSDRPVASRERQPSAIAHERNEDGRVFAHSAAPATTAAARPVTSTPSTSARPERDLASLSVSVPTSMHDVADAWTSELLLGLVEPADPIPALATAWHAVSQGATVTDASSLIALERQLGALEAPLAMVCPSVYEALITERAPHDWAGETLTLPPDCQRHSLYGVHASDATWLSELAAQAGWGVTSGYHTRSRDDRAGVSRSTDADADADSEGRAPLLLSLGQRDRASLDVLLSERRAALRALFDQASSHGDTFSVCALSAVSYLGSGLGVDVAASVPGADTDRVRAAWANAWGSARRMTGAFDAPASTTRQVLTCGDTHFVVGRLVWPVAQDAPRFATGGISLGECLLPYLLFTPPAQTS